ncbi:T9SS type A sorting domain-containing protein [Hwangdonia lutea]|uniref:T9SS type A sorting domain-containing protein n=1 Tax=Hwangdonia lutea TaxID=3075823 RepID=A0AA97EPD9_9FLAO|nr:T9SS type A sorting domain-containing protein [Hwangdonia sp. SCSIO 19198]WOD43703.1 T9SS type A sorting domain-containing protein [Hwangdonia sp. SCSIO 19198]
MKRLLLILLITFFYNGITAQQVTKAEYFFNTDPGLGLGNSLNANTNAGTLNQSYSISTTGLGNGFHNLFIRVFNGESNWSHYDSKLIYVNHIQNVNQNITEAEYYFDTDPGFGNATTLNVTNQPAFTVTVGIPQNLAVGIHQLFIRVKTNEGNWSHYDKKLFYVGPQNQATLTEFEYFIDNDDEVFPVTITNPNNQIISNIDTNGLAQGTHLFYIRAKTSDGKWSMYDSREFTVDGSLSISETAFRSISLYPNPVKDHLTISSDLSFIIKHITVYNASGKTVFRSTKNNRQINLSGLAGGIYILNLNTDLGSASYKLIKH